MNINWLLSDSTDLDPDIDIDKLHGLGSFWGSWRTWRAYNTDNVIVYDYEKAIELVKRNQQSRCNLYVPVNVYQDMDKPAGVKIFDGSFQHEVDNKEEIVGMHLVASVSDIVLLLGFNWTTEPTKSDKLLEHRANNYRNLTKQVIVDHPTVQWVLVDHKQPLRKDLLNLSNLTQDSANNIVDLLTN